MALPDHFEGEDVIITIERESQTGLTNKQRVTNIEGKVLSWNISGGATSSEDVYTFGNKTFNFQKPREKFTISFDVIVNNNDFGFMAFGSSLPVGARLGDVKGHVVSSADPTYRHRVIFWFQSSASHIANTARTVIVPSKTVSCYRMIFCDVKVVSFEKEFSADEYMKGTLSLEFSATDSSGLGNYYEEEGLGVGTTAGGTNGTLASLTTTVGKGLRSKAKGYLDWSTTASGASTPNWLGGTTSGAAQGYRNS